MTMFVKWVEGTIKLPIIKRFTLQFIILKKFSLYKFKKKFDYSFKM